LLNPGKVVNVTRMDDPALMRFNPTYQTLMFKAILIGHQMVA